MKLTKKTKFWTNDKIISILLIGYFTFVGVGFVHAAPIEHKFKSPSFSGINTSSHYLTIENQEHSRKKALKQEIKELKEQMERDAENTTLAKFIRNVESRIYSTLSRQIVDGMFGENPSDTGSFNIEGTGISYVRDGDSVVGIVPIYVGRIHKIHT